MTATLAAMLTYCRPCGSKTENQFINRFLIPLTPMPYTDPSGNIIIVIPDGPNPPTIAWSCHTDTVHHLPGRQSPIFNPKTQNFSLAPSTSSCLGADDTAGVWLMREMILARKPGLYIFHYGEEVGGIGSNYIAKHTPELLRNIKAIIALDRRGFSSVITHQGSRCASDAFALSLASQLPNCPLLKPDPTGTFTDTANYTNLVPECSNLSVGYDHAHSPNETLNLPFLLALRQDLIDLDYSQLVIARDHLAPDPELDRFEFFSRYTRNTQAADFEDLVDLVKDNPEAVAELLVTLGYDSFNLIDDLDQTGQAITIREGRYSA